MVLAWLAPENSKPVANATAAAVRVRVNFLFIGFFLFHVIHQHYAISVLVIWVNSHFLDERWFRLAFFENDFHFLDNRCGCPVKSGAAIGALMGHGLRSAVALSALSPNPELPL